MRYYVCRVQSQSTGEQYWSSFPYPDFETAYQGFKKAISEHWRIVHLEEKWFKTDHLPTLEPKYFKGKIMDKKTVVEKAEILGAVITAAVLSLGVAGFLYFCQWG